MKKSSLDSLLNPIRDANHITALSQPELTNEAILRFLIETANKCETKR